MVAVEVATYRVPERPRNDAVYTVRFGPSLPMPWQPPHVMYPADAAGAEDDHPFHVHFTASMPWQYTLVHTNAVPAARVTVARREAPLRLHVVS